MTASVPAFTPARDQQFKAAAAVISAVQETEHAWLRKGDASSPYLSWMPFQAGEFMSILFECVPQLYGREFLDVGCGPGTKMQLAAHFFGLEPCGIEVDPSMAAEAEKHGVVSCLDALKAPAGMYGNFDLVWMYRPFRHRDLQFELDCRVMKEMKPGAVLAGGQWEVCPGDLGWQPVVDDWELRRGAWMKLASS